MTVKNLNIKNYDELIGDSDKVCVVKFWHHECHMCQGLQPIYARLAEQYKDKFNFFEVNTMHDKGEVAGRYDLEGVPEIYFVDGAELNEIPFPNVPAPSGYAEGYLEYYLLRHGILKRGQR